MKDVELRILETLILYGEPMRAHWIARKLKNVSDSLVNYHLPKMVYEGILLTEIRDGVRVYTPQPIFMNAKNKTDFLALLTKFVEDKQDLFIVDPDRSDEQVINVLRVLLKLVEEKLKMERA